MNLQLNYITSLRVFSTRYSKVEFMGFFVLLSSFSVNPWNLKTSSCTQYKLNKVHIQTLVYSYMMLILFTVSKIEYEFRFKKIYVYILCFRMKCMSKYILLCFCVFAPVIFLLYTIFDFNKMKGVKIERN